MKKLITIMLGLLIVLAGCGNKDTAPEKQKEITMTDIIKSSKKHAIFTGMKDDNEIYVDEVAIVKNGKAKVYHLPMSDRKTLDDFADKSINDLEKIGDKVQNEQGYPKAYYTTVHVWLDQTYPEDEDIDYEFRGYTDYTTQYESDLKRYQIGKNENEAHKYMDSVRDFEEKSDLKSEGKPGYSFVGLPKSMTPADINNKVVPVIPTEDIDNNIMSLNDSKIVGLTSESGNFVATKVSDKTTLKKEKKKDYKDSKIVKTYKVNNN
ncbi:hypothetical protein ACO2FG_12065 [Staphylococcus epidermidis]